MLNQMMSIRNPSGLHMRPAGVFVKAAAPFQSSVKFSIRGNTYNAKSMISVLSAAVKRGEEIELSVEGEDEKECMDAIIAAIEDGLGEG